jgi:hypothetical protein
LLKATNRLAEAEPLMRRALAIDEQSFGPDHPNVARDLNNLAQLLKATNRLAEAEPLMRRAVLNLLCFTAATGHVHPNLHGHIGNFFSLSSELGRSADQVVSELLTMSQEANVPFEVLQRLFADPNS